MADGSLDAEVVIVGGGIAGLATAVALQRAGVAPGGSGIVVLERHPELRATGTAMTVFPNGWFALRALGVAHKLTSRYDVIETSRVTNLETATTQVFRFAGNKVSDEVRMRAVGRKALLEALAEEFTRAEVNKGEGIGIAPHVFGHLLRATLWKITKDGEVVVYAVDLNHRKESCFYY